jgi:hypothetical protein
MLSVWIMVRDFFVAMALAWAGVSIEATHTQSNAAPCADQTCQTQTQHH